MWRLTIGGVDRTGIVDAFSASWALNDRARANLVVGDFLPDRYQEIVSFAADGTTPLFGGVILARDFTGRSQADGSFTCALDCGDWFTYADWCYTTNTYAIDVSLRTVLSGLVSEHLAAYGIVLDPAQPEGPTIAAFSWVDKRVSDALRELSDRTGYVARISPGKRLSMFVPGTIPSPFSITEARTNCHDLTWRDSDRTPYNAVTVTAGPGGVSEVDEERHNGDGVRRRFPLFAPFQTIIGALVTGSDATGNDPGGLPVGIYGVDDMEWTVDLLTNELVQREDGPVRAVGEYVLIWYNAVFPFTVHADQGLTPVVELIMRREDVRSMPQAQEIADQKLASYHAAPREVQITTDVDGLDPGQALTIDLPATRAFSGTCLVTSVALSIVLDTVHGDRFWQYTIDAIESEIYQGNYLDAWRAIAGVGEGNSGSIVGGGGGSSSGGGGGTGGPDEVYVGPDTPPGSSFELWYDADAPAPAPPGGAGTVFLGGSRAFGVIPPVPGWIPVAEYVDFYATAAVTGTVRADVWARRPGVGVQVGLWNVTDGAIGPVSTVATSTVAVPVSFAASVVAGKAYRLVVAATVPGEDVFAIGSFAST